MDDLGVKRKGAVEHADVLECIPGLLDEFSDAGEIEVEETVAIASSIDNDRSPVGFGE